MSSESTRSSGSSDEPEALILRAVLRLGRRLRQEAPARELSGGALALLVALHRLGPVPAAVLARSEGLQPQSLSRLLARMEKDGMIERAADAADARVRTVAITRRGRGALSWAMNERRRWLRAMLDERLDAAERATLADAAALMLRLAE